MLRFRHILSGLLLLICGGYALCANLKNPVKAEYRNEVISAAHDSVPVPDRKNPVPALIKTKYSHYFSIELPEPEVSQENLLKIFRGLSQADRRLVHSDQGVFENSATQRVLRLLVAPNAP